MCGIIMWRVENPRVGRREMSINDTSIKDTSVTDHRAYKFVIPIDPVPWKRPGQSRYGRYDLQKAVKNQYRAIFAIRMNKDLPLVGSVHLVVNFFMPIPKSLPLKDRDGWHSKKPDLDNLVKLVLDSMNGICFVDDSQVSFLIAMKGYDENPRTEIIMVEKKDDDAEEFRRSKTADA